MLNEQKLAVQSVRNAVNQLDLQIIGVNSIKTYFCPVGNMKCYEQ